MWFSTFLCARPGYNFTTADNISVALPNIKTTRQPKGSLHTLPLPAQTVDELPPSLADLNF